MKKIKFICENKKCIEYNIERCVISKSPELDKGDMICPICNNIMVRKDKTPTKEEL